MLRVPSCLDVTAIYENNTAGAFNQTQQIAAAKGTYHRTKDSAYCVD